MDVDVNSRPTSSKGQEPGEEGGGELLNARGKVQFGDDNVVGGYCKPGEDCEDCA